MLTNKNMPKPLKQVLKKNIAQSLQRYANGDQTAGYNILRYAKAGFLVIDNKAFDD